MKINFNNRHVFSVLTIFLYLIPILFFASYSISLLPKYESWPLLSYGLLFISIGTLGFTLLLYYWEQGIRNQTLNPLNPQDISSTFTSPVLDHAPQDTLAVNEAHSALLIASNEIVEELRAQITQAEERTRSLEEELESKNQLILSIEDEKKQLIKNTQDILQDYSDYKGFSEEQLKQKNLQINSLQQMVETQKSEMEKRQDQIQQLDTKVRDLSYEVKTLVCLHETDSFPNSINSTQENLISPLFNIQEEEKPTHSNEPLIRTPAAASALLKRCVNSAQKLTGAHYYGNMGNRNLELPSSPYSIDQRCLFDNLRSETTGLILVYSPSEQKLVFSNNQFKSVLGWHQEKFIQEFPQIIQESVTEWKQAISHLGSALESQTNLLMKTKNGQSILFNCHFGAIPTGLFKHYVIAILYPATVS